MRIFFGFFLQTWCDRLQREKLKFEELQSWSEPFLKNLDIENQVIVKKEVGNLDKCLTELLQQTIATQHNLEKEIVRQQDFDTSVGNISNVLNETAAAIPLANTKLGDKELQELSHQYKGYLILISDSSIVLL